MIKTSTWKKTQAEIVDFFPKGKKFNKFFLFDSRTNYTVTYRYYIKGNNYTSKRVNFYDNFPETDFKFRLLGKEYISLYIKIEDAYLSNETIEIYYNKEAPEESVIIKKIPFLILIFLLINLVIIAIIIGRLF